MWEEEVSMKGMWTDTTKTMKLFVVGESHQQGHSKLWVDDRTHGKRLRLRKGDYLYSVMPRKNFAFYITYISYTCRKAKARGKVLIKGEMRHVWWVDATGAGV